MITNYFVQHGLAVSKDIDQTRPLSVAGREQTRRVAAKLTGQKIDIQKIYHSGKLRAVQTAQIFSEELAVVSVSEIKGLNPNDNAEMITAQLFWDGVMYVGHLPNIEHVVTQIITGGAKDRVVKFQNSAVACVEIEQDVASLKWFITADLC